MSIIYETKYSREVFLEIETYTLDYDKTLPWINKSPR